MVNLAKNKGKNISTCILNTRHFQSPDFGTRSSTKYVKSNVRILALILEKFQKGEVKLFSKKLVKSKP